MPYTLNIPGAADIPAQSQPLMQDNCNQIAAALAVDHGPFNVPAVGEHERISFIGGGVAPATLYGLYATGAAMFLRNNGTNIDMTTNHMGAHGGYAVFPSNVIVRSGEGDTAGSVAAGYFSITAFAPAFSQTPIVLVSASVAYPAARIVMITAIAVDQFTVASYAANGANALSHFYWLAIGPA